MSPRISVWLEQSRQNDFNCFVLFSFEMLVHMLIFSFTHCQAEVLGNTFATNLAPRSCVDCCQLLISRKVMEFVVCFCIWRTAFECLVLSGVEICVLQT